MNLRILSRRFGLLAVLGLVLGGSAFAEPPAAWPPPLRGATNGTVRIEGRAFLAIPAAVAAIAASNAAAAPFDVAATPPVVDLACHAPLPDAALNGTGWTAWGDIGVADDGKVYCAIGDHGRDAAGTSRAYLFEWDPAARVLRRVVDLNAITPRAKGEPTWSKVHAGIHQAADGGIYFTGTLNDGARAVGTNYHWSAAIPGGQLYRYDPRTGKAEVFANLPAPRCTATTQLDRERAVWWCNLEGPSNALFALCLTNREVVYRSPEGAVTFNRNFALARDGAIYFNGRDGIWKYDPAARGILPTRSAFPGPKASMRSSTRESRDGRIYGVTMGGQLFRYQPAPDTLDLLGPEFLAGNYTTVCVLSPDEQYLYYLPGAHGGAFKIGTPVIQYAIATGRRKVLAFLADAVAAACDYVPAGTYGVKLSPDGGTLYVNFNGHAADAARPKEMKANGFGFTAFAAIHIPASERP